MSKEGVGGAEQYHNQSVGLGGGCAAAAASGLLSILHGLFAGGGQQAAVWKCQPGIVC